jgi:AAA domain-containing protein
LNELPPQWVEGARIYQSERLRKEKLNTWEAQRNGSSVEAFSRPPLKITLAGNIALEPKQYLINGFLGRVETSVWFGPPDSGKSAVIIDAACHVASGLGYGPDDAQRHVDQGAVLYLACERGAVVKRRVKAWLIEHGLEDIPLGIVADAIDLRSNQADSERVIAAAAQLEEQTGLGLAMVVIDTMNRALSGGDENSPKDMGMLVKSLDRIHRKTGAHVAVIQHCPADRIDRMRGHTLLSAAVDLTVQVTKNGSGFVAVEVDKANDLVEKPRFEFQFKTVVLPIEPETTAPVVLQVQPLQKSGGLKSGNLAPRYKLARDVLAECAAGGESAPIALNLPAGYLVTKNEDFRTQLISRGVIDPNGSNPRADFKRIKERLQAAKAMMERDGYLWPI